MGWVPVVASVLVGVAFVVAGASKLALGDRWPIQATQLGSPVWVAPFVPWVELAIGAALVAQLAEPGPALAAIWLLLAFTALILKRIGEGKRPACACFGAWSAKPIGASHVARNAVLLVLAVLAALPIG